MTRPGPVAILLLLAGVLGVLIPIPRLSRTADEPIHIESGLEWWRDGTYTLNPQNPPLARVMAAAPLFWADALTGKGPEDGWKPRRTYMRTLVLSRLGSLPFYLLSCLIVFGWSRRLFGERSAPWSVGIYVTLATVTAYGGLATTDIGYAAMLLATVMAAVVWLGAPGAGNAVLFGASLGAAIGTKFSVLVQFPAAFALIVLARAAHGRRFPFGRAHVLSLALYALPMGLLTLAAIYRFSCQDFAAGVAKLWEMNRHGFAIWLWGRLPRHGVWYFFPVVFFFKSPLPFLAAAATGGWRVAAGLRRGGRVEPSFPLLAAAGVMLPSMAGGFNLGVRHVLAVYPLLAIPAGYGLHELWRRAGGRRGLAAALAAGQVAGFVSAFPDPLAYFNPLAGRHPERISLDSDYDWGQENLILDEALQARGIDAVYFCGRAPVSAATLLHARVRRCPPHRVTGWVVVGRASRLRGSYRLDWLDGAAAVGPIGDVFDLYRSAAP